MSPRIKNILRVLAGIAVIAAIWGINRSGIFQRTLDWINTLGVWAAPVFVVLYALSCVCLVPGFIFAVASGILFGVVKGGALSLLGGGLGAAAAFLIGRYAARAPVQKFFAHNREFNAIESAVSVRGWKIIVLARLSPIFPFWIGNYAFGLTQLSVWEYFFASVAGSIPAAFAAAYAGTLLGDLAFLESPGRGRTSADWALLAGGLVATIVLSLYLRRVAETALQNFRPADNPGKDRIDL